MLRQISLITNQFCWLARLHGCRWICLHLEKILAPSRAPLWQWLVENHSMLHTLMCIRSPAPGVEWGVSPKFNWRSPPGLWSHWLHKARLDQYPVQSFTGHDSGYCKLLTKEQCFCRLETNYLSRSRDEPELKVLNKRNQIGTGLVGEGDIFSRGIWIQE